MKLHLGCGNRRIESKSNREWINVDIIPRPSVDVICDARDLSSEFENDCADLVYASHLLEYFDEAEAIDVLREWRRVLVPGRTLRLAVPDFEALLHVYAETGGSLASILGPLYGRRIAKDRYSYPDYMYHKMVYDFPTLALALRMAGFRAIRKWDWRQTEHSHVDDGSQAYFPHMDKENGLLISLNVECTK